MAEVKIAIGQRRERLEKIRLEQQQREAEEAARQQVQQRPPTTPRRKTSSSRPRSPLRSCRSLVKSAAVRHQQILDAKARSCSTARDDSTLSSDDSFESTALVNKAVQVVVSSPSSPARIASPQIATTSAFLAAPEHTVTDNAPAQLVEPLEAD